MSNVGRPREGMKACGFCGSTTRDSNGQCRCRNTAYRALRGVAKTTADKARKVYDTALKANKGDVDKALATMREEFPSLAPRKAATPKKAAKKPLSKEVKEKAARRAKKAAAPAKEKPAPERYVLTLDGFEERQFARKDAAIKNGVRSEQPWKVSYKGKVVAASDDLL